MQHHFAQYHKYTKFKQWRRRNYIEKELEKNDSLPGAQIQLDHFKNQMIILDKALEKMYKDKADKIQFKKLEV